LLIRGARQVGKTHLVRQLGEEYESFVEINLEQDRTAGQFFEGDLYPKDIIMKLSAHLQKEIIPGKTLLFIDEIQTTPRAIIALRYFYEQMPELHVVAAGSLIDFAIQQVGVPVGRVQFLHIYPLSFIEFLEATGRSMAVKSIAEHSLDCQMPAPIHEQYLSWVAEYLFVGGMPAAISAWSKDKNPIQTTRIHQSLIEDYRQDFEKYAKKTQLKYVKLIFDEAPLFLGESFKYTSLSGGFKKRELSPCLDLLETAGVISRVYHTAGQGLPLGAQVNLEHFKLIFVDVALAQTVLGLDRSRWITDPFGAVVNQGGIVESFVGQELLAYSNPHQRSSLYYWHRTEASATAEVDYLQPIGDQVVPIEVKAGESGWLKSLKIFLEEHPNSPYGLRISGRNYAIKDSVHSYPLYAIRKAIEATN
jgi:predicted AAA+ superfamily ATPase